MARKKLNLAWIANDSARKATFKKRKKGLMKKVSELSILCDVTACAIVYGPQDLMPEVWPSPSDAADAVIKFKNMPEMEKSKKMMNQEGLLHNMLTKLQEQLHKQEKENQEMEATLTINRALAGKSMHDMSMEEVTCLAWAVEMKAKAAEERIELIKGMSLQVVERAGDQRGLAAQSLAVFPAKGSHAALDVELLEIQRQDWMVNMMNPSFNDHSSMVICPGEGMMMMMHPYVDHHDPMWIPPFF